MLKPDPKEMIALANTFRQQPEVLTYLTRVLDKETKDLPFVNQNVAVAQGRCQVLLELTKLLSSAPEMVADPTWQRLTTTHTDRSV